MKYTLHRFVRRRLPLLAAGLAAFAASAATAGATVITFDDAAVSEGATLSSQYSSLGVTFLPGLDSASGVTNPTASTQGFATNTDMTVTASDLGGGVAAPASGLLLHAFGNSYPGWIGEDGDAVFRINFAAPISSISMTFAGVSDIASSGIFGINASNAATQSAFTTATGTSTVSLTFTTPVSSVVVTEGDYNDWVGVDNINFTAAAAAPEPGANAALAAGALGLGALAWKRRRSAVAA